MLLPGSAEYNALRAKLSEKSPTVRRVTGRERAYRGWEHGSKPQFTRCLHPGCGHSRKWPTSIRLNKLLFQVLCCTDYNFDDDEEGGVSLNRSTKKRIQGPQDMSSTSHSPYTPCLIWSPGYIISAKVHLPRQENELTS
jgi:hypothetical protein